MRKKWIKISVLVLSVCMLFTACGGEGADDGGETGKLTPVPLEESAGEEKESDSSGAVLEGLEESSGSEEDESPSTDTAPSGAESAKDENPGTGTSAADVPVVSCEVLRDARKDDAGGEIVYAEYPVFAVTGDSQGKVSAAITAINEEWKSQSTEFLDRMEPEVKEYRSSIDASGVFGQEVDAHVTKCDENVICLTVLRVVTEGGPHPNNYFDAVNLDAKTGEELQLTDVLTVDDTLKEEILGLLHENYPEVEFDDASVEQEIGERLAGGEVEWYFWEDQVNISFPEGAFGYPHAVGSLGVLVPIP